MAGRQADYGRRKGPNKAVDVESIVELQGNKTTRPTVNWGNDLPSILLLLVLYTLQGIPIGLSGSIPFLLVDKVKTRRYTYTTTAGHDCF